MELCQLACDDIGLLIQGLKEGKFSNVNKRSPGGGFAVLHICSAIGNLEAVQLLVNAGADINLQDAKFGRTALHWAFVNYHLDVVSFLLSKRADLDLLDKERASPIDVLRERAIEVFGEPATRLTELWTWGNGSNYQLGHSSAETVRAPKRVKALPAEARTIDISSFFAAAVTVDGAVYTWGFGQFRLGHQAQAPLSLSAERQPSQSSASSLSHSTPAAGASEPRDSEVTMLPLRVSALSSRPIAQVAVSNQHALAVTSSGELFSWGSGKDGKLGHEAFEDIALPRKVRAGGLEKKTITRVAVSDRHSCALTSTGDLFTWGHGAEGQLGHSLTSSFAKPKLVTSVLHVVDVACSETHTIAMSQPPQGSNMLPDAYIFGCGVTTTPQKIHIPSEDIASFAAARGYTLLLTRSGLLYQSRSIGQPAVRVRAIQAKRVINVSGKENSFTVVDSNGVLYGWTAEALQPNGDIERLRVWKELRGRAASVACGGSCSAALTSTPQFDTSLITEPDLQPPYAEQLHPLPADLYALLPSEITAVCAEPLKAPLPTADPLAMPPLPSAVGLGSERFTDVTVVFVIPPAVKARVPPLRLHRVILSSRSSVLRDSLKQLKAGEDTLEIDLGGQYPYASGLVPLAYFIFFLYCGQLPDLGKATPQDVVSSLLQLSRRFKLPQLAACLQQVLEQQQRAAQRLKNSKQAQEESDDEEELEEEEDLLLVNRRQRRKSKQLSAEEADEMTKASAQLSRDIATAMGSDLVPPPYGDVEIRVAADTVDSPPVTLVCHRALLVARSEFFRSLFLSGMREARKSKVDLLSVRAATFRLILLNMYTGLLTPPNAAPLTVNQLIDVLSAANQYILFGLKLQVEDALASHVHIGNVLSLYAIADRHEALKLRALCRDFILRNLYLITLPHLFEMGQALREDLQEYVRDLEIPHDSCTVQMLSDVSPVYMQRRARAAEPKQASNATELSRSARKIKKKLAQIDALEAKRTLLGTAELAKVNARTRLMQELNDIETQLSELPAEEEEEEECAGEGSGSGEGEEEEECEGEVAECVEEEPVPVEEVASWETIEEPALPVPAKKANGHKKEEKQQPAPAAAGKRSKTFDRASSKTVPLTSMHMHQQQPKKPQPASPSPAPVPAAKGWKRSSEAVDVPRKSLVEIQAEEEGMMRDIRHSASPQSSAASSLLQRSGPALSSSHSPVKPKGYLNQHRPLEAAVNWKLQTPPKKQEKTSPPAPVVVASSTSPPYLLPKTPTSAPSKPPARRADVSAVSPVSPADFPSLTSRAPVPASATTPPKVQAVATTPPKKTLLEIQNEELLIKEARAYRDNRSLLEIQQEEITRKQKQQENLIALQLAQLEVLSRQGGAELDEDLKVALGLVSEQPARGGRGGGGGGGGGGGRGGKQKSTQSGRGQSRRGKR